MTGKIPLSLRLIYILPLLAFLFLGTVNSAEQASAASTLIVEPMKIKAYDDALRGFKNGCAAKINSVSFVEYENGDIAKTIRKTHPDLIVAIGMEALAKVRSIRSIPIVYLMVLHPNAGLRDRTNITGVSMEIPPEKHFSFLHKLLPSVKRIGFLYDPRREAAYARKALATSKAFGFELVAKEVHASKEVPQSLEEMKGKIDLLWVLPDLTVVTPDTAEFLLLFSIQNGIPVHIFSRKYLEMGALTSLDTDPFEMGVQAGEVAATILQGAEVPNITDVDATNAVLSINLKVAKKLGVTLNGEALQKARVIR